MRKTIIAPGEHYHICNRGVNKQNIFHNWEDYYRFLFLILYFQSTITFEQISRLVKQFVQHSVLDTADDVVKKRTIELVTFCIMPNHFHLILKELEEGGISAYMHRVLNSYSKYYNTKYEKSGHVFQGPYRSIHVSDDRQLLYLSAYIHKNPRELKNWFNREGKYQWSSYSDYINENRWGKLLLPGVVIDQFKGKKEYKKFVETNPAKLLKEELEYFPNF